MSVVCAIPGFQLNEQSTSFGKYLLDCPIAIALLLEPREQLMRQYSSQIFVLRPILAADVMFRGNDKARQHPQSCDLFFLLVRTVVSGLIRHSFAHAVKPALTVDSCTD